MTSGSGIFAGLNEPQAQAVRAVQGETLVIAGAGSGKTAVLTRRCAYLIAQGEPPGSILCLTFTNKAAKEMNERLDTLLTAQNILLPRTPTWNFDYNIRPLLCTFHALGVRLLREFGEPLGLKKEFTILDTDDQQKIIKNALKELNLDPKQYSPKLVSYFISQCKQELLTADFAYQLEAEYPDILRTLYKKYEAALIQSNVVDFDDLIMRSYLLLKHHPDVQKAIQTRWHHILVDEFQDTNKAQFELIKLLYQPYAAP
jgi:DNA helicase II / ATP-dependent DNA helicase PcrA